MRIVHVAWGFRPWRVVSITVRTRASVTYAIRPLPSHRMGGSAPSASTRGRPPVAAITRSFELRTAASRVESGDQTGIPPIETCVNVPVEGLTIHSPGTSALPTATAAPFGDQTGVPEIESELYPTLPSGATISKPLSLLPTASALVILAAGVLMTLHALPQVG